MAASATALAVVPLGLQAPPSAAVSVSNVIVTVAAPDESVGTFQSTVTVKNTGTLSQPSGSEVSLTTDAGTISNLPAGCKVTKKGKIECTAGPLSPGASQSFKVSVTPDEGATSVSSRAEVEAAMSEFGMLEDDGDTDEKVTQIVSGVGLGLTNNPQTVTRGKATLLTANVTNRMPAQEITLVVNTGSVSDDEPVEGCEGEGTPTLTCTASYAALETKSFDIVVISPATPPELSSFRSTATASGALGSGTAEVDTGLTDEVQAYVPEGEQIESGDEDDTTQTTFTVQEGSTADGEGVPVEINEVQDPDRACGEASRPCFVTAAEALFPNGGNDVKKPFIWDITYNVVQENCGSACPLFPEVFYVPSGADPEAPALSMEKCPSFAFPGSTRCSPPRSLDHPDQVCLNFVSWNSRLATHSPIRSRCCVTS